MTKLTLLLAMLCLAGCNDTYAPLIVTKTETACPGCSTKYFVTINGEIIIYTDTLYAVGDTIK